MPAAWSAARKRLFNAGKRAQNGDEISDAELLSAASEAYGLSVDDVAPLVAWTSR
jgi:hypothetical protein